MKSRPEVSAGGVVFRRAADTLEVLICKDGGYHKWVLPKGLVGKNETPEAAALREVREEVGVTARVIAPLREEKYIYTARGVRVFKTVYYFLMEYASGSEADRDHEMEAVRWTSLDEAIDLMGYQGAKNVLKDAKTRLLQTS